jgi:hypothetical protein
MVRQLFPHRLRIGYTRQLCIHDTLRNQDGMSGLYGKTPRSHLWDAGKKAHPTGGDVWAVESVVQSSESSARYQQWVRYPTRVQAPLGEGCQAGQAVVNS